MPTPTQYAELIERLEANGSVLSYAPEEAGYGITEESGQAMLEAATAIRELQADAARYQFWKPRLVCADFGYPEFGSVLIFSLPDGAAVSGNLDLTTDEAAALSQKAKP